MGLEHKNISEHMKASAQRWRAEAFGALENDTGREVRRIFSSCQSKIAATKMAISLVETLVQDGNAPLAFDVAWEFSQNFLDRQDTQKLIFLERMIEICMNQQQDKKAYNLLTEAAEIASIQGKPDEARRFSNMSLHLDIV